MKSFVFAVAVFSAALGLSGCKTSSGGNSTSEPASVAIADGFKGRAPLRDEELSRKIYDFARQRLEVSSGDVETHLEEFELFKFDVLSKIGNRMNVELSGRYRKTPDLYEDPEGAMACYRFNAGLELVESEKQWLIPEEKPFGVAKEDAIDCI